MLLYLIITAIWGGASAFALTKVWRPSQVKIAKLNLMLCLLWPIMIIVTTMMLLSDKTKRISRDAKLKRREKANIAAGGLSYEEQRAQNKARREEYIRNADDVTIDDESSWALHDSTANGLRLAEYLYESQSGTKFNNEMIFQALESLRSIDPSMRYTYKTIKPRIISLYTMGDDLNPTKIRDISFERINRNVDWDQHEGEMGLIDMLAKITDNIQQEWFAIRDQKEYRVQV